MYGAVLGALSCFQFLQKSPLLPKEPVGMSGDTSAKVLLCQVTSVCPEWPPQRLRCCWGGLESPLPQGPSSPCASVPPPSQAGLDFGQQPEKSPWLCLGLGSLCRKPMERVVNPLFLANIGPPVVGVLSHKFSIDSPREGKGHKYYSR